VRRVLDFFRRSPCPSRRQPLRIDDPRQPPRAIIAVAEGVRPRQGRRAQRGAAAIGVESRNRARRIIRISVRIFAHQISSASRTDDSDKIPLNVAPCNPYNPINQGSDNWYPRQHAIIGVEGDDGVRRTVRIGNL
jgi:hypothetical protein